MDSGDLGACKSCCDVARSPRPNAPPALLPPHPPAAVRSNGYAAGVDRFRSIFREACTESTVGTGVRAAWRRRRRAARARAPARALVEGTVSPCGIAGPDADRPNCRSVRTACAPRTCCAGRIRTWHCAQSAPTDGVAQLVRNLSPPRAGALTVLPATVKAPLVVYSMVVDRPRAGV